MKTGWIQEKERQTVLSILKNKLTPTERMIIAAIYMYRGEATSAEVHSTVGGKPEHTERCIRSLVKLGLLGRGEVRSAGTQRMMTTYTLRDPQHEPEILTAQQIKDLIADEFRFMRIREMHGIPENPTPAQPAQEVTNAGN
ncbi:MAG TPA: hypothetical protein VM554_00035 [Acidisarcina sp.]|nr:hypothetical protein [Acidisarcina sp.]